MADKTEEFIKKTFLTAGYMTLALFFIFFLFFSDLRIPTKLLILTFGVPILFCLMFIYFMKIPDLKILGLSREINKEIIFAGRFLIIELDSGVSLYQAMINICNSYEIIGSYFREVIEKVKVGTTLEVAINEAVETVPSDDLRKIMWQILNSLKTGSNVSSAINSVTEQIIREQQIAIKEYGRKLNPLAMFYMMIAVIVPSIGIMLMVIVATFMGFPLKLPVLLGIAGAFGFVQFMFLSIIQSSRPAIDL